LCEVVPACPPLVSELVDRCLKKDPAQRYRDAEQLLAALTELPLPQAPAAHSSAAPRRAGSSRLWRAGALGVLAGAGLGVGGALALLPDRVSALQRPRALESVALSARPSPSPSPSPSLSPTPTPTPTPANEAAPAPVPARAAETRGTRRRPRAAPSSTEPAPERARPAAAQLPSKERADAVPTRQFPFVTTNPYAQRP
jgi:hypothetical protein